MAQVPTGTTFYVASALAAAKAVSGISNATEAVVNATAHGLTTGDDILLSSGWGRLNLRAFKVTVVTPDTFKLNGEDTTNTDFFPAGSGGGSFRKVNAYTQITQVLTVNTSGGEPKSANYKYMEADVEYSVNDGFTASSATMELDADSNATDGYKACRTLTAVQSVTVVKSVTRNGGVVLRPCTVALNEDVIMADGQINKVRLALNGTGKISRY